MPPGGETFRFFAPLGENVVCTREASMPPLQQKRNVFGNQQTPIYRTGFLLFSVYIVIPNKTFVKGRGKS